MGVKPFFFLGEYSSFIHTHVESNFFSFYIFFPHTKLVRSLRCRFFFNYPNFNPEE